MVSATVQFYDVIVFVHVTAVVVAFGPSFSYGLFFAIAGRDGGAAIPSVGRAVIAWDRTAGTIAMTLILLSGIYLASDGPYGMGSFFVSWGFVAIVVLFGLVHGFFIPQTKRVVETAERDLAERGELSAEVTQLSAPLSRVGPVAGLLVVLTIYVMVAKPF